MGSDEAANREESMTLREWFRRRRLRREAIRLVDEAFASPDVLRGTSLRGRHAARWVLIGWDEEEGRVARVDIGIVRHPRPYPFSTQAHKVLETWTYHVAESRFERQAGRNLTRESGKDAD